MTTLNVDFYKGQDLYSDGDVEADILSMVKAGEAIEDILRRDSRWAVQYHLHPMRRNLLEWYDFDPRGSLLEIGGGCGAFSGLFAEKLNEVKVVELSRRRSEIIYHRHFNYPNLEILVGNLNEIEFKQKFDYVTSIGVLEYAAKFTHSKTPHLTFLKNLKTMLKPEGILVLAIENKFGLKYWAGAKEDHTGCYFDSIENYPRGKSIQTFSKLELTELLQSAGFSSCDFYYPLPDYKMPEMVFSDAFPPTEAFFLGSNAPNYDNERYCLFNEHLVYANLIKNKMGDIFANSFLVFAQ